MYSGILFAFLLGFTSSAVLGGNTEEKEIVGGRPARAGEIPYILSFQQGNGKGWHFCGASLVERHGLQFAITAAHCVAQRAVMEASYHLLGGSLNKRGDENSQKRMVSQIISHEEYNSHTQENDIAILLFDEPFEITNSVQVIDLPSENISCCRDKLRASGWGYIKEGGSGSDVLRTVVLTHVSNRECHANYAPSKIFSSNICAGEAEGGKDSCKGDSGGPLALNATNGPVLLGITSWGHGCARPGKPGVYTRVSSFLEWIDETISNSVKTRT